VSTVVFNQVMRRGDDVLKAYRAAFWAAFGFGMVGEWDLHL